MKRKKMLGLVCGLLLAVPGAAMSQSFGTGMDAGEVADKIARSSVRTIYTNLRKEGIPWKTIRDQYMPGILTKSLRTVQRGYTSEAILNDFLPTLLRSYYSEIDQINRENHFTCVEQTFIVKTIVPFIKECEMQLGPWRISVTQVVDMVLNVSYPYQVCSTGCRNKVRSEFSSTFSYNFPASRFGKICAE
ncbi:hypothetical protein [Candidatus Electronema sp. JM]|uniref:hypothetical protein n=1 Tax=Candidatus Electronema sp. JM TaxID=3401571 RepID=UPI003AA7DE3D